MAAILNDKKYLSKAGLKSISLKTRMMFPLVSLARSSSVHSMESSSMIAATRFGY